LQNVFISVYLSYIPNAKNALAGGFWGNQAKGDAYEKEIIQTCLGGNEKRIGHKGV
jgi:hypothetical protein